MIYPPPKKKKIEKSKEKCAFFLKKFGQFKKMLYFCIRKSLLSACGSLPASGCIPFLLVAIQRHRGKAERKSYVKSGV